jgi:TrfA protein
LAYRRTPDPIIEAISADALAVISKREQEIEDAKVYQLAFWPNDERAMPGDFIACALFSASKRTQYVDGESLASVNGLTVIFTGKRLTQVHADVWMGIMHLGRNQFEGDVIRFRERTLLDLIGRHTHLRQRDELKQWIRQLQATSVLIQDDAKRKRFGGSLLPWHEEDDGDGHTIFAVDISRELAKILSGNFWKVNWELRKKLQKKPLALWLQTYFARFTRPVSIRQLHSLAGSTAPLKMFRHHLRKALDDLHAEGGYSAAIDRETDVVKACVRPPRPPRVRPANDGRQTVLPFARKP